MLSTKRKLAIVGLKESDLDVIPTVLKDERWELVSLADADAGSVALRLAEVMRLPTTANVSTLDSLGIEVAICGSTEAQQMLGEVLGDGIATMSPQEAVRTVSEPEAESETEPEPEPASVSSPPIELGAEESEALGTLTETLNLALDRQRLLKWILELAIGCTGAGSGSIMLLDESRRELRIAMAQGLSSETVEKTRQRIGEGIAGKVVQEGRPLLISGERERGEFSRAVERSDVKAAMCVPLMSEGRPIGVLNVGSSKDPPVFQEKDLHLLERLAERATQIIQKTLAYSDISSRTFEFTLREAVEAEMARDIPLVEKVQLLASSLAERVNADCYVYLPKRESENTLSLFASSMKEEEPLLPASVSIGRGFLGRAVASGRPQMLLPAGVVSPSLASENVGILCAPLKIEERTGLLVFDSVSVSDAELEGFVNAVERVGRFIGKELDRETSLLGLKEQAEVLSELNQVASSVMAAETVEDVVRTVSAEGVRLFKADLCLVACEDGRSWYVDRVHGVEGVEEDEKLSKTRELLTMESVKEMRFVSSESVDETLALELERLGVSSFMAGPLRVSRRFLGVCMALRVSEGSKEPFSQGESRMFASFCEYAAHGLQTTLASVQTGRFGEKDEETGLLGTDAVLRTIEDEGKRFERYGIGFCITVAEVEGLTAAFQRLGSEWRSAFLEEFSGGLRKGIREVDFVGRTGEATFVVVSPQTPREGTVIQRRIEELLGRIGAVRYVSPAPQLMLKCTQFYWPKDICDLHKARQIIADSSVTS
jgi:transcriptional regulator with GAF, ATPase, and Fis domain